MTNTLILCIYGRGGYEIINKVLLNNNYLYNELIIFTHTNNNDLLLNFIKYMKLTYYTENINKYEHILKNKIGFLLSFHYRIIIHSNILNSFKGIKINLHPSLLPNYKGCFSSVWAIINNEKYTGITYHILTENIDKGNIVLQKKIPIQDNDTAFSLFHKLITLGLDNIDLIFNLVTSNSTDDIHNMSQKQIGIGSYYSRKVPYGGIINNEWSVSKKNLFIRAMYFPPHKGAILIKNDEKIEIKNMLSFRY
jgi:methionyl-tRNA formyltransferase